VQPASPVELCRAIHDAPSSISPKKGSAEERPQSTQVTRVGGSIPCMAGARDEPEFLWLSRGIEQRFAESGGSRLIGAPCDDYEGSRGNMCDHVQWTKDGRIEAVPPVGKERSPDSEGTGANVFRSSLCLGISERASKYDSAYPVVARGDLSERVASGRESERANPCGFDVAASREEIECSDKRGTLVSPELDSALALSLSRPIEHQYPEPAGRESASFGQHARPIGFGPVAQDDGSAVVRSDVPPADSVPLATREVNIVEAQRGRIARGFDRPTPAGERFGFRAIGPDRARNWDYARGNKSDYQNDRQEFQVEDRVEERADLRAERDIALLLIPPAQACKVPVRVSGISLPPSIAMTIIDLRRRGVAASAWSVSLDSDTSSRDGDTGTVAITLPAKLNSAARRRLATFAAGRYCAARAVEELTDSRGVDIPVSEGGAPVWPIGLTGSISHSDSIAIAAVARTTGLAGIGIDYEASISHEVANEIEKLVFADSREAQVGRGLELGMSWPELATVTFSAKESLYKALRPLVGRFFEFHDVRLVELTSTQVTLRLATDLGSGYSAGSSFAVRYSLSDGCVATAVVIPSARSPFTDHSLTRWSSLK
jgi:enterobactin synthetase component D